MTQQQSKRSYLSLHPKPGGWSHLEISMRKARFHLRPSPVLLREGDSGNLPGPANHADLVNTVLTLFVGLVAYMPGVVCFSLLETLANILDALRCCTGI
jgi:hypothetical protein